MKISYIFNSRIPTEMAYGIQITHMCEALADLGNEVELIVPTRRNRPQFKNTDPFSFFGVKQNFELKKIWSWDPFFLMRLPNGIYIKFQATFFIISLFFYLLFKKNKDNVFYVRDEYLLPLLLKFPQKVFWEAHTLPSNSRHYLRFWNQCAGIVAITQGLKDELTKLGVAENKIIVAPDGVNLENYNLQTANQELQKKLNLSVDKKTVIYTGHLFDWKGVQTLAEAANFLDDNIITVFVGGTDFDLNNFKNKNKELVEDGKILLLGQKTPKEIPEFLATADCLVLPNSGKDIRSEKYTSPMKMFEYMAAGKSIIASDLPSIKEILNENNAIFFKPDDAKDLAEKIKYVLENSELAEKKASQAKEDVKNYTWQKRAEKIIKFYEK